MRLPVQSRYPASWFHFCAWHMDCQCGRVSVGCVHCSQRCASLLASLRALAFALCYNSYSLSLACKVLQGAAFLYSMSLLSSEVLRDKLVVTLLFASADFSHHPPSIRIAKVFSGCRSSCCRLLDSLLELAALCCTVPKFTWCCRPYSWPVSQCMHTPIA